MRSPAPLRSSVPLAALLAGLLAALDPASQAPAAEPAQEPSFYPFNGTNGTNPNGLTRASDGNYYGTTQKGGLYGAGTIFRFSPQSGAITRLHSFRGLDGATPRYALTLARDGRLYGVTQEGGRYRRGTLFRISTAGQFESLYSFQRLPDPAHPSSGLLEAADGALYGLTVDGGTGECGTGYGNVPTGCGTLYRLESPGKVTVLHSFQGRTEELSEPRGELLQASDGLLYGIAIDRVFRCTTSGGCEIFSSFDTATGDNATGALVEGEDGALYGTTQGGGSTDTGMLFRIDPDGSFHQLFLFTGDGVGIYPNPVVWGPDGALYGTTQYDHWGEEGREGQGHLFRATLQGEVTSLFDFEGMPGDLPVGLLRMEGGFFSGVTLLSGGDETDGTVFRVPMP